MVDDLGEGAACHGSLISKNRMMCLYRHEGGDGHVGIYIGDRFVGCGKEGMTRPWGQKEKNSMRKGSNGPVFK